MPKWSKAAFQDKFNIMKGKLENGEEPPGSKKYADIDTSLARLQKKLREGSALETGQRGSNRVSALAGEIFDSKKMDEVESSSSALVITNDNRTAFEAILAPLRPKPSGKTNSFLSRSKQYTYSNQKAPFNVTILSQIISDQNKQIKTFTKITFACLFVMIPTDLWKNDFF